MNTHSFSFWAAIAAVGISIALSIVLIYVVRRRRHPLLSDVMEHVFNDWVNAEYIKKKLDASFPVVTPWKRLYAMLDQLEADGQVVKRFHCDLADKGHRQYRLSSASPEVPRPRKAA